MDFKETKSFSLFLVIDWVLMVAVYLKCIGKPIKNLFGDFPMVFDDAVFKSIMKDSFFSCV